MVSAPQLKVNAETLRISTMSIQTCYVDYDLSATNEAYLDGCFNVEQIRAVLKLMEGNGADG